MAENKSYSFYVSDNDKSLNDFIAAQSNLSMTIRLLLKGFICNYEDKYPDVVNMDLRELISNTGVDEERLAEIAAMEKQSIKGKERVSHEEQERFETETNAEAEVEDENKTESEQSSEVVIDLGNADFDDELTDTVDDIDDNQDDPDEAENTDESTDISEDPADMLGEMPGDATDDIPDDDQNDSDDDQNDFDDEEQSDTTEPEKEPEDEPKKRNLREEYNKKQSGDEMVDADDLMSFMGDGPGL